MLSTTDSGLEFQLSLPCAGVQNFISGQQAGQLAQADLTRYCLPVAANQAAVNALSSSVLLYRVSHGLRHELRQKCMLLFGGVFQSAALMARP
jgi:hypothetical protein